MPQYSDISETQKLAIARFINYIRMEERYKDLMESSLSQGNLANGKTFFKDKCISCHTTAETATLAKKQEVMVLF